MLSAESVVCVLQFPSAAKADVRGTWKAVNVERAKEQTAGFDAKKVRV